MSTIYRRLFRLTALLLVIFASVQLSSAAPMREQTAGDALSALKASLTPEQQQAIEAVYKKYGPELAVIVKDMPDPNASPITTNFQPMVFLPFVSSSDIQTASSQAKAPNLVSLSATDTARMQQFRSIAVQTNTIRAQMEQEFATILTPEQISTYQAIFSTSSKIPSQVNYTNSSQPLQTASTPQADFAGCGLAAGYATYARASAIYANSYAAIAAFDPAYKTGTSSADAAFRAFNGAQYYSLSAHQNVGGAYLDIFYYGNDFDNLGVYALKDMLNARDAAHEGWQDYTAIDIFSSPYFVALARGFGQLTDSYSNSAAGLAVNCH